MDFVEAIEELASLQRVEVPGKPHKQLIPERITPNIDDLGS